MEATMTTSDITTSDTTTTDMSLTDKIIDILINDADTNKLSNYMYASIKQGDLETIKKLEKKITLDTKNINQFFSQACRFANLDIINYFREKGVDVRFQNDCALRYACCNGQLEVAKYLVSLGCDIHANDNECLRYGVASENLNEKLVEWLLESGANVNIKCKNSNSVITYACGSSSLPIIALVIEAGAELTDFNANTEKKLKELTVKPITSYMGIKSDTKLDISFPGIETIVKRKVYYYVFPITGKVDDNFTKKIDILKGLGEPEVFTM